jgi:hypothetical protein
MCIFLGASCIQPHIIPVAILPGIDIAREAHDLDLFRWVPFYTDVTIIDPEENVFKATSSDGDYLYSFYHVSQVGKISLFSIYFSLLTNRH